MSKVIFLFISGIILSSPFEAFCQSEQVEPWNYSSLLENNINDISCYEYNVNKKGKTKKDSVLIYKFKVNKKSKKIFGKIRNEMFTTHGKLKNPYSWENIQYQYDSIGRPIKLISYPIKSNSKSRRYNSEIDSSRRITSYKYYKELIRETKYENITETYTISEITKDTFTYKLNDYSLYKTIFNENDLPIKRTHFRSDDSINYPNLEWTYNEKNLLLRKTSFTRDSSFHSKGYYMYDNLDRLTHQVDSTGWYLNYGAYLKKSISYKYNSDGTYLKIISDNEYMRNNEDKLYSILYNSNDKPLKKLNSQSQIFIEYEYQDDLLIRETHLKSGIKTREIKYKYSDYNLLFEKFDLNFERPKLSKATRYFYNE